MAPLLLLIASGCGTPKQYLEKGKKAAAAGNQAEAVLDFRKAIQKNSQYVEAFRQLANSQAKLGDLRGALANRERALALRPDDNSLRVEVAEGALSVYLADPSHSQNRYDQVTKLAQEMLAKNPKSFDGLRFQAALLYATGRTAEAIAAFRRANAVKPMMPAVILPFADALRKNGQTAEAENLATALVRQHKNYLPIYDWLYSFYKNTNRPAQAEAILVQQEANNPLSSGPILQLASYYREAKKPAQMAATLNQLLARPKDFPDRFLLLANFYESIPDWDEAAHWLETGIKEDGKNSGLYRRQLLGAYGHQKRKEALQLLGQLIQEAPNDWALRSQRAKIWIDGKNKDELLPAIAELQQVIKMQPRDPRPKFLLGQAYLAKGDKQSAREMFAQAAAQQKQFLEPRLALADLDRQTQNFQETVRLADEILAIDPNNFQGKLLHASGLTGLGKLDLAQSELEALARQAPQSRDIQLELGTLSLARKQYAAAGRIFSSMYRSGRADDVRALAALASVYLAEGRGQEALQTITLEVNRLPNSLDMHELLAVTALQAGKPEIALEQYRKLVEMAPDNPNYYLSMADLFRQKNDYGGELAALEKAGKLEPNNAVVAGRLALAEQLSGNRQAAAADYKRSLDIAPSDPALLNNQAYFLAEDGGDLDLALTYSQEAIRKAPGNPALLDTLAWVYTKRKMNDSAIQILTKLVRENPDVSSYHYHLAAALAQKGDRAKAKAELTLALSKKPSADEESKITDLIGKLR